jgi:hypothetical protein
MGFVTMAVLGSKHDHKDRSHIARAEALTSERYRQMQAIFRLAWELNGLDR